MTPPLEFWWGCHLVPSSSVFLLFWLLPVTLIDLGLGETYVDCLPPWLMRAQKRAGIMFPKHEHLTWPEWLHLTGFRIHVCIVLTTRAGKHCLSSHTFRCQTVVVFVGENYHMSWEAINKSGTDSKIKESFVIFQRVSGYRCIPHRPVWWANEGLPRCAWCERLILVSIIFRWLVLPQQGELWFQVPKYTPANELIRVAPDKKR